LTIQHSQKETVEMLTVEMLTVEMLTVEMLTVEMAMHIQKAQVLQLVVAVMEMVLAADLAVLAAAAEMVMADMAAADLAVLAAAAATQNKYTSFIIPLQDKTYGKIISNWNDFIDCIPDDEDKHLLLGIMSKCYFKYQKSIKAYGLSHFELSAGF
jgi:hypothetical protein